MEYGDIVNLIGSVGFPIVMCIVLFKYITTLTENHKNEVNLLKNALDANMERLNEATTRNTQTLVELSTLIKHITHEED
nr:MAG TPA_asm: YvrJ protein family protein [Caudoviricetes sp.]